MDDKLMLTIDIGTQSARVALFDKKGECRGIEKISYEKPYICEAKGMAEQDPNFYFDVICKGIKKLKQKYPKEFDAAIGVSLDTIRDTAVLLDENYKVVRRTVLWLDQRLAKGIVKSPLMHRFIFKLVGMSNTIKLNKSKSMSLWFQENEPEMWKKVKHYGNISSYLNYRLVGEFVDSPASLIGHYPLDFKKRRLFKSPNALTNIYRVPLEYFPKLIKVGDVLGKISKEASKLTGIKEGLPLYSTGSDKSCESLGLGALTPDVAAISYGTASTIEVTTKKYYNSEPFLPSYPSCVGNYYNLDVQIYRGYWMINWFLKYFCHYKFESKVDMVKVLNEFNKQLFTIPPGSDGLLLQPYWQPGLARPLAKGAVVGFTDTHTSIHFYKAIIEGIAYALREALERFQKLNKKKVKRLMISGGGSQSDEICQVTANLFGIESYKVQTYETSSLGSAIAGFVAAKEFKTVEEAVKSMVHLGKCFKPNMEEHKQYDILFNKGYKKLYPSLFKIYKDTKIN